MNNNSNTNSNYLGSVRFLVPSRSLDAGQTDARGSAPRGRGRGAERAAPAEALLLQISWISEVPLLPP